MNTIRCLPGMTALALGLTLVLSSFAFAGQPASELSQQGTALTDTVVAPDGAASPAAVSPVQWRAWPRVYGGWYPPVYRPYGYVTRYVGSRPYRCWWNGYRWKCRPMRVIVY